MNVSKEEFLDWKLHPVTSAVFKLLEERIQYYTEELIDQTATYSQSEMAEKAGAIKALRDLITIQFGEDS